MLTGTCYRYSLERSPYLASQRVPTRHGLGARNIQGGIACPARWALRGGPFELRGSTFRTVRDSPLDSPPGDTGSGPVAEPLPEQPDSQPSGDLDVLRSLFELAGDAMQQAQMPVEASGAFDQSVEGDDHFLPREPDALLHWIQAMDQALERRLRNLSHAVNVQMLRSGLAQTLLPISLLDAVLKGQVETQPTATNVLRLRLPLAVGDLDQGMDVLCVLLRSNDLEFDSPRLRQCRKRLRTHHHALLTMVRQQRHWQRRSLDREARTHWQTPSDSTQQLSGD